MDLDSLDFPSHECTWQNLTYDIVGDDELPIGHVAELLIRASVWLKQDSFYKMLAAYFSAPSIPAKLIKEFPICMIQGRSGTGKTQLTTIAHSLHYGNRPGFCNAASTPVSIRNTINGNRFSEDGSEEFHFLLGWDDVGIDHLKSPLMFTILKNGVSRRWDAITMSGEPGQNKIYRCFGKKVFCSIHAPWIVPELRELKRRLLAVKTYKCSESNLIAGLVSTDDIDYEYLDFAYDQFWRDSERLLKIWEFKRELKPKLKKLVDPEFVTIYLDTLASGIVGGVWPDIDYCLESVKEYFQFFESEIIGSKSVTVQLITDWVAFQDSNNANPKLKEYGYNALFEYLKANKDALDIRLTQPNLTTVMNELGYRQAKSIVNHSMVWVKNYE